METLNWQSNYVARCHVRLFEAAGGNGSWLPRGAAGEFYMRPLGSAVLYFQLRNVLDDQIVFEHTMHKPESLIVLSQRFFAIRLENGSFRGFGFSDFVVAREMKEHIQKAIKPHNLEEHVGGFTSVSVANENDTSSEEHKSTVCASKPEEDRGSSGASLELVTYNQIVKSSKWKLSWKRLTSFSYLTSWNTVTEAFGWQEHEMEIGYPTDVKHVAHVGWDGPSVRGPSWIDELKQSPNYATGPLRDFGQPTGSDWIHDALSAAKWTSPGHGDQLRPPPPPPAEFLDSGMPEPQKRYSRWNHPKHRLSCFNFHADLTCERRAGRESLASAFGDQWDLEG
ncbi:hypothetical protein GOP47_0018870 [Adiantum capillus-veneris]|uniref:CRIB domain-containing protein n=1 Tax=Adiantum capillus-veneris TaxID=13818 RepID=A0A9D4UE23_ADICA|nr:hypothetical protein GOP47_0018870 [Adiantum capillus-veneris]